MTTWPPVSAAIASRSGRSIGELLGWSWPERLSHALTLAAGGAGGGAQVPEGPGPDGRDHVDLVAYERLLDAVTVDPPA